MARTGELVSREQRESAQQELWLDWSSAAAARDVERRLSRLCAWVLQADAQGLAYGLRLPGLRLPAAPGGDQKRLALEALAEWA